MVCGSHSLFNIARIFGGKLPKERASLIAEPSLELAKREVVLAFPKRHSPKEGDGRFTAGNCLHQRNRRRKR
jgi:hypothetical protein